MNKKFLLLLALACIICFHPTAVYGHDGQTAHDRDLKWVLFGNKNHTLPPAQQASFQIVADAVALCVDQFSPNETAQRKRDVFDRLKKTANLSIKFEDIDLNKGVDGKNITANTHRMYTHQGWSFPMYPNPKLWAARKQLLVDTVKKQLFSKSSGLGSHLLRLFGAESQKEQYSSFCAFLYYIHLLGDHMVGDMPGKLSALYPLARSRDRDLPGILPEISKHLDELLNEQKNTYSYQALAQALASLVEKADDNYYQTGGINSPERCAQNQAYAEEALGLLSNYIPNLLKHEDFFKEFLQKQ